jgi:hypothetical protein
VVVLVFGLMAVRSFGEVPAVENPSGKLGFAKAASQSTPSANIGQPSSQATAIPVTQVTADPIADDSSFSFTPECWWVVVLVVLLVSGVGILFRKMDTEP